MLQRIVYWLCDVFIGDSESDCPRCKGKGRYTEYFYDIVGFSGCVSWKEKVFCKKCNGTGKLDWVEKVVGKK